MRKGKDRHLPLPIKGCEMLKLPSWFFALVVSRLPGQVVSVNRCVDYFSIFSVVASIPSPLSRDATQGSKATSELLWLVGANGLAFAKKEANTGRQRSISRPDQDIKLEARPVINETAAFEYEGPSTGTSCIHSRGTLFVHATLWSVLAGNPHLELNTAASQSMHRTSCRIRTQYPILRTSQMGQGWSGHRLMTASVASIALSSFNKSFVSSLDVNCNN